MTITEEGRSQWYEALRREDSRQVSALLERDPDLLKVGWGEEWRRETNLQSSPLVKRDSDPLKVGSGDDASQFKWKGKPWKERTALHVGVKRGNAKLVEQVLVLCNVAFRRHSTTEEQDEGGSEGEPDLSPKEIEEAEESRTVDAILRLRKAFSRIERANHEGDEKSQEIDLLADVESKLQVNDGTVPEHVPRAFSKITRAKHEGDEKGQEIDMLGGAESKLQVNDGTTDLEHVQDQDENILVSLLKAKDGEYDLDAVAIAALNGKTKIFLMLLYAMGKCKLYEVATDKLPGLDDMEDNEEDRAHRVKLKEAMEEAIKEELLCEYSSISCGVAQRCEFCAQVLEMYKNDLDFNFLPWREYLFHFMFSNVSFPVSEWRVGFTSRLWKVIRSCSPPIWHFLLNLKDGRGRTPMHAAVERDFSLEVEEFLIHIGGETQVLECARAALDGAGRTPLHRAWAVGRPASGLFRMSTDELARRLNEPWEHSVCSLPFSLIRVSDENGFQGRGLVAFDRPWQHGMECVRSTTFYTAVLHGTVGELKDEVAAGGMRTDRCKICNLQSSEHGYNLWMRTDRWEICNQQSSEHGYNFCWSHDTDGDGTFRGVELAALVGDTGTAQCLPLGAYNLESKKVFSNKRPPGRQRWPALHIAANTGNYEMVKLLLDALHSDPYIVDHNGNTALHHALNVITIGQFKPHLLHYVNCEHIQSWRRRRSTRQEEEEEIYKAGDNPLVDRQGCINLLLEAGCDIFKTNNKGQPPYPQGKLSKNATFRSWWYSRQAKEFDTAQRTLSSAATSIAVVATLVATASYVGPLQPPLGLAGDPSQIQDANLWVRIFIFCDTMSFYLAIAAVTLSLIPNLPIPQQPMKDEVRRTRHMVAISVTVLFPSIIFVLVAFISSSIAVVRANVIATGGTLTVTTASIGGLLCLVTFAIFFVRLLAFLYPRSERVRTIYNATNLEYLSWFASLRKSV